MRIHPLPVTLALWLLGLNLSAQNTSERIESELSQLYEASELPGFSVAIVTAEGPAYQKNFGYQSVNGQETYSTTQRYNIASISKTFIGLSLMKLIERGTLALSTPINDILPFQVQNPHFPESIITVEHLARHTSGIRYGSLELKSWYLPQALELSKKDIGKNAFKDFSSWAKNSPTSLGEFLKQSLTPEGLHFSKSRFAKRKPGTAYEYSNLGAALAAYIVELKTGRSYDQYIEALLQEEFGFTSGVWKHTAENLPSSYFQNKMAMPAYLPILYPTGGMMLSQNELIDYLAEMIRGFKGDSDLMAPDSFQQMMTAPADATDENGIFWELSENKTGHNGANYGTTCFMSFNKQTGIGKIFMTNISSYQSDELLKQMIGIWRKLAEFESAYE